MNEKNRKMMEFNIVEYTHMARLYLKILGDRMDYIQDADMGMMMLTMCLRESAMQRLCMGLRY